MTDKLFTPDEIIDFLLWANDFYSVEGLVCGEEREVLKQVIEEYLDKIKK